jgi:hypothetical protein
MPARRHPIMNAAAVVVGLGFAIANDPAHAADYAGTWAADLANCKTPQERADAPLVLSSKGYDQHEAHCTFSGLKPTAAGEWAGKAACSVEGDSQAFEVKLTVSGDTLTLTEDGASRDLLRCP